MFTLCQIKLQKASCSKMLNNFLKFSNAFTQREIVKFKYEACETVSSWSIFEQEAFCDFIWNRVKIYISKVYKSMKHHREILQK